MQRHGSASERVSVIPRYSGTMEPVKAIRIVSHRHSPLVGSWNISYFGGLLVVPALARRCSADNAPTIEVWCAALFWRICFSLQHFH